MRGPHIIDILHPIDIVSFSCGRRTSKIILRFSLHYSLLWKDIRAFSHIIKAVLGAVVVLFGHVQAAFEVQLRDSALLAREHEWHGFIVIVIGHVTVIM